jgi:hypothetical protein
VQRKAPPGAFEVIFSYSTYLFVLSSIIVVCLATTLYRLMLAKEGHRPSVAQHLSDDVTWFSTLESKS